MLFLVLPVNAVYDTYGDGNSGSKRYRGFAGHGGDGMVAVVDKEMPCRGACGSGQTALRDTL